MKPGERIVVLFATGFYTGYFPIAPATFGTLTVAIPLFLALSRLTVYWYAIFTGALFLPAVWLAEKAEKIFQKKDCSFIVIDEIVGFLITMFLVPCTWTSLALGFILFRFFDIVKPPPANLFNTRKKGGLDVVMDDVIAGIYANLLLQGLAYCLSGM